MSGALNPWKHLGLGTIDSGRLFQQKEMLWALQTVGKRALSIRLDSLIQRTVGHTGSSCDGL